MGYSLMRWLRYTLLAAALLLAGLWASVRLIPRWQARDLTPIMTAYLRAAAAGDSGALVQVTVSPTPVNWALLVHHKAPAFMERAASQGRAEFVRFHGDTAILSFRLATPVPDPTCVYRPLDQVTGRFVRGANGTWRILSAGVDAC